VEEARRRPAKRLVIAAGLAAVAAAVFFLAGFQVCRDWAFICEHTGSRKGHREWFFGGRSGDWYEESKLETFVKARPGGVEHRWTSYAGTGKNIFGRSLLHGHGMPGPILQLRMEWLDAYVEHLDDGEKMRLYELFKSGDNEAIEKEVRKAFDLVLEACRQGR
jgi:hypothetical protein